MICVCVDGFHGRLAMSSGTEGLPESSGSMKDDVCDERGCYAEGCVVFRGVQLFVTFDGEGRLLAMIIGNALMVLLLRYSNSCMLLLRPLPAYCRQSCFAVAALVHTPLTHPLTHTPALKLVSHQRHESHYFTHKCIFGKCSGLC